MYTEFFGLNEKPFSISPDPRYLYLSQRHADALAHLIYGISESGGFIQLTGEVGTGKTTLIRSLLEQLPDKTDVALILNPQLSTKEFLQSICQELGVTAPAEDTVKAYIDSLNAKLLEAHAEDRRVVLIVDEAQTLAAELLEQVRLLTNLETAKRKLLQIILIGQPELREVLARPDMRQIAQRITGRYHLEPLTAEDAGIYVKHRLRVAGAQGQVFTNAAIRRLYRLSAGIPRLINVIADRALLAGYTQERRPIGADLVNRAADEVFGRSAARRWLPWVAAAAGLAAVAVLATSFRQWPDFGVAPSEGSAEQDALAADVAGLDVEDATASATVPLAELFADPDWATSPEEVARTLFRLWNAEYVPGRGDPCAQAAAQGLRCLSLRSGAMGDLRRLDLPVVLILGDADPAEGTRQIVLSGLGYDTAELSSAGRSTRVDVADLTHYWYGEHWLLWKPVTDVSTDLTPGMRSERVPWLRASLAQIFGATAPESPDPLLYDDQLVEWVREYQRHRRLDVDGVVGSRTQVALQSDLDLPGTPSLTKEL